MKECKVKLMSLDITLEFMTNTVTYHHFHLVRLILFSKDILRYLSDEVILNLLIILKLMKEIKFNSKNHQVSHLSQSDFMRSSTI
jgi:hypothetical protein